VMLWGRAYKFETTAKSLPSLPLHIPIGIH
jgi:hypothetical protein